jgi:hypothetical protein
MTATTQREHRVIQRAFVPLEVRAADLPPGICGRMLGIGLTYDTPDAYNTMWAPGCLDVTKRSKVPAGKVGLYAAGPMGHQYGTRDHIGVVRASQTIGNEEQITADLFDTEAGRSAKEYIGAVLASGATTGLSIGCYVRRSEFVTADGRPMDPTGTDMPMERYTEVELEEFTLTPRPAVPGAEVAAVRQNPDAMWAMLDAPVAVLTPDAVRARMDAGVTGSGNDPSAASGVGVSSPAPIPAAQSDASHPAHGRVATEAERARALAAIRLEIPYHG